MCVYNYVRTCVKEKESLLGWLSLAGKPQIYYLSLLWYGAKPTLKFLLVVYYLAIVYSVKLLVTTWWIVAHIWWWLNPMCCKGGRGIVQSFYSLTNCNISFLNSFWHRKICFITYQKSKEIWLGKVTFGDLL